MDQPLPVLTDAGARSVAATPPVAGRYPSAGVYRATGHVGIDERTGRLVGTAVFLTGEVALEAGARYSLELDDASLFLYGPLPGRSRAVAMQRPLRSIDATVADDRLAITTVGERSKLLLAFATTDPPDPSILATAISQAATSARGGRS